METHLVIDIETVANERANEFFASKNFTAPDRYKKEEAILKYVEEQKRKAKSKAALKAPTAQIICIGYQLLEMWRPIDKPKCFYSADEKIVLSQFAELLVELEIEQQKNLYLWGYNSLDFDFPMLFARYQTHDIGVPAILSYRYRLKDIMGLGCTSTKANMAKDKLDDRLFMIGIQGKIGSGNQVQIWYDEEAWDKITTYCMDDVSKEVELLRRSRPYKDINVYQG